MDKFYKDCLEQHNKYYYEGYYDSMFILKFGMERAEEIGIDVYKYSPGSAREYSYIMGYKDAIIKTLKK